MRRIMILMTTLLLLSGSLLPVSAAGLENKNILWERTMKMKKLQLWKN